MLNKIKQVLYVTLIISIYRVLYVYFFFHAGFKAMGLVFAETFTISIISFFTYYKLLRFARDK